MTKGLEKRRIGNTGLESTFISFGALEIGRDWGLGNEAQKQRPTEAAAGTMLHAVLDAGINLIDTASAYHRSEERIGKALAGRRGEFILASKCGEHNDEPGTYYDFSYDAIKQSIDRSLKLLQTDVIDIMQIHFGPDPEKVIADGETVAAMKDAQKEGKIRFLGASIDGDLATRCIESGDFDVMQMDYNLLDQRNAGNIALCKEKGIGVFIRTGLGRGKLTSRVIPHLNEEFPEKEKVKELLDLIGGDGDKLASLALEFLYQNDGISSVLVGTKNINHLKENFTLLEHEIDQAIMQKAREIVKSEIK